MALIGHCLRNNLETNSAWILMGELLLQYAFEQEFTVIGATIRLAQSIGLHEPTLSLAPPEKHQRYRLWYATLVKRCR